MLNTAQVAELGNTTRDTVKREIRRGNLQAEKVSGTWIIEPGEAKRWAAKFESYAWQKRDRQS